MSYDVLEKQINLLTTEQQQEVFDFIHFLISKNQGLISDFSGVPELLNVSVSSAERISDESLEKKNCCVLWWGLFRRMLTKICLGKSGWHVNENSPGYKYHCGYPFPKKSIF